MYEAITYEYILKRMLDHVPNTMDKREGSLIYDALAPAAMELKQLYIEADVLLKETFADTASREYLIRRAEERGIVPYPATCAVVKAAFHMDVPLGSRFRLENLYYRATERLSPGVFALTCEKAGREANGKTGKLVPVEFIEGLTSAEITELLIPGDEEEDTEHFRTRYLNAFHSQAFGGNIMDYKEKAGAIAGVGGVKVYPAWNGGGTVKLVLIDSGYGVPTSTLLQDAQTRIDPVQNQGQGYGLAPIGHIVTVEGVVETFVNITLHISYRAGWNWETLQSDAYAVIDRYFEELNAKWADIDNIIVRISQLESRLLELEGVSDIARTSLNGIEENLKVLGTAIVKRGIVDAKEY